jgi:GxxExxY protein
MTGRAREGLLYEDLTRQIIGAAMEVHRELGPGFMEKAYENALFIELNSRNIPIQIQQPVTVKYKGHTVSEHILDVLVDGKVVLELKAVDQLDKIHEAQLIAYLKTTKCKIGLLINFAKESLEWKRIMLKDQFEQRD